VVAGLEPARSRRAAARSDRDLARGPARLAQALGLTGDLDGADACGTGPVNIHAGELIDRAAVRAGPRIGLTNGATRPWRFWLDGERSVSSYRPAVPRRRRAG
jgi:DNA-3-methyladenine glycosylase